jgi:hypothetical protein
MFRDASGTFIWRKMSGFEKLQSGQVREQCVHFFWDDSRVEREEFPVCLLDGSFRDTGNHGDLFQGLF